MDFTTSAVDPELRQTRLSRFGRVLALMTLGYVGLLTFTSIYVQRLSVHRATVPLLAATAAFAALWLLLRGTPRSRRFVRAVELSTLFVGTAAFSTIALILDLTASPDMAVHTAITFMLLAYAVYVPSTARHTLLVAALMTLPLLGCIYVAFSAWDPALHDPPATIWPKGQVGDMAVPATIASAILWAIAVAMAAAFSQTIHGLRKAVSDIRRLGQYTLEQKLGEGGMGVVYRASHAMLRRPDRDLSRSFSSASAACGRSHQRHGPHGMATRMTPRPVHLHDSYHACIAWKPRVTRPSRDSGPAPACSHAVASPAHTMRR